MRIEKKFVLLAIVITVISVSYGYLDWAQYHGAYLDIAPIVCNLRLHGGLYAPDQYRIGVWTIACAAYSRAHLHLWLALTLIDVIALWLTLGCLAWLLVENPLYLHMGDSARLLSFCGMFLMVAYVLPWGHWFQYAETMVSSLYVAINMLLVQRKLLQNRILVGGIILVCSVLQGFVRADVAVLLHAGFLLAVLLPFAQDVPLGRYQQAAISALSALCAGCVQLYLMRIRFPETKFWVKVFMAWDNLHPFQWGTVLIALLPYWMLLAFVLRRRYRPDATTFMLLVSSVLYFCVWFVIGLLDEVRVFFPFCLTLLPTAAVLFVTQVDTEWQRGSA